MTGLVQGILAGGAVTYLSDNQRTATRELVILQANHALLLVSFIFAQAAVTSLALTLLTKTVLVLTPVAMLGNILTGNQPLSESEKLWMTRITNSYWVAAIVCSLAVGVFGGYAFSVSALALLAAKVAVQRGWIGAPWWTEHFALGAAAGTAMHFAVRTMLEGSALSQLALLATGLLLGRSWWKSQKEKPAAPARSELETSSIPTTPTSPSPAPPEKVPEPHRLPDATPQPAAPPAPLLNQPPVASVPQRKEPKPTRPPDAAPQAAASPAPLLNQPPVASAPPKNASNERFSRLFIRGAHEVDKKGLIIVDEQTGRAKIIGSLGQHLAEKDVWLANPRTYIRHGSPPCNLSPP